MVYAKRPFAGPAQVLDYVGRYTLRVAISNNRLVSTDGGKVCFRWKDYRNDNRQKMITLPGEGKRPVMAVGPMRRGGGQSGFSPTSR